MNFRVLSASAQAPQRSNGNDFPHNASRRRSMFVVRFVIVGTAHKTHLQWARQVGPRARLSLFTSLRTVRPDVTYDPTPPSAAAWLQWQL
ncbi:hypothetical protein QQF64_013930 [Cirrhinus molitorella]|uniref:Uncharacterized protein n=1 Tax=Cirrhinus molitorella TaxID=172907 RepID=A0ABR3LW07_9TELE